MPQNPQSKAMNTTDTPRTDAARLASNLKNQSDSDANWPWDAINRGWDHACELERDLNRATKDNEDLSGRLHFVEVNSTEELARFERELNEAREILMGGLDRDPDDGDSLRTLCVVTVNALAAERDERKRKLAESDVAKQFIAGAFKKVGEKLVKRGEELKQWRSCADRLAEQMRSIFNEGDHGMSPNIDDVIALDQYQRLKEQQQ